MRLVDARTREAELRKMLVLISDQQARDAIREEIAKLIATAASAEPAKTASYSTGV